MMQRVKRAMFMLLFRACRVLLKAVDSVSARLHMRLYVPLLRRAGVTFVDRGPPRYISTGVKFDDFHLITIGQRAVISDKVILLTHDYSLTTALAAIGEAPPTDVATTRAVVVGNNVFVGMGSILLPGTTVGNNTIIGAGAVVRGAIPEGSLVVGNPGRVVGSVAELGQRWKTRLGTECVKTDRC